jgi:hypothetical protein
MLKKGMLMFVGHKKKTKSEAARGLDKLLTGEARVLCKAHSHGNAMKRLAINQGKNLGGLLAGLIKGKPIGLCSLHKGVALVGNFGANGGAAVLCEGRHETILCLLPPELVLFVQGGDVLQVGGGKGKSR